MIGGVTISDKLNRYVEGRSADAVVADDEAGSDVLSRFFRERERDYYAWKIVLFFAENPFVRFNRTAIVDAINHGDERQHIKKALDELIQQKIIQQATHGKLLIYFLAEDMRRLVLKLTRPPQKG